MAIFPIFARSRHAGRLKRRLTIGGALLSALAVIFLVYHQGGPIRGRLEALRGSVGEGDSRSSAIAPSVNLPPPDLIRPLSTEEAKQENAERPFAKRPDNPAAGFALKPDALGRSNAVTCLTQAVYYEAATEGITGGRAVAQVVLNRVRHPTYPASVCGVVYQGSERRTGCQFSFTCDGSLLRVPMPGIWNQSRKIAEEALAGKVFAPVGHATHYHADYVVPYWASSLDKAIQIGRHIFYRFRGSLGDSRVFRQAYSSVEVVPSVLPAVVPELTPPEVIPPRPSDLIADDPVESAVESALRPAEAMPRPIADTSRGTLIIDGGEPVPPLTRRKPKNDCDVAGDEDRRLRPLGANQVRGAGAQSEC
jgi:spore germination cell wall hydrolase CwlJ-like protein